jgi:phage-related protein
MKERFKVLYSKEADDFLNSLSQKAKDKILSNIMKSKYVLDSKLFKKLEGTDIWEFRTKYDGNQYRLLAFWDVTTNSLVVATHGFVKKEQKTPKQQIRRAEEIRAMYLRSKEGKTT